MIMSGYTSARFLYGFSNHVVSLLRIAKFPLLTADLTLDDGNGVVVVGNWLILDPSVLYALSSVNCGTDQFFYVA